MNNNQNLFFYGMKANLVRVFGIILVPISFMLLYVHWILFLMGMGFSIYLMVIGSSMRFDYQRRSGHIIHQGDGKW